MWRISQFLKCLWLNLEKTEAAALVATWSLLAPVLGTWTTPRLSGGTTLCFRSMCLLAWDLRGPNWPLVHWPVTVSWLVTKGVFGHLTNKGKEFFRICKGWSLGEIGMKLWVDRLALQSCVDLLGNCKNVCPETPLCEAVHLGCTSGLHPWVRDPSPLGIMGCFILTAFIPNGKCLTV